MLFARGEVAAHALAMVDVLMKEFVSAPMPILMYTKCTH